MAEKDKSCHVLLLENDDVAGLILEQLEKSDISCRFQRVDSREEFQAALRKQPPDLIMADFAFPGLPAEEALQMARENMPDVPFICISSVSGEEHAVDMLHRGATDYVVKQRLGRLIPAVERALRERTEHQARAQAEGALNISEERYRALVHSVRDYAIILLDLDGIVLSWNQGAAEIFGYSEHEMIGRDFSILFTPEDRSRQVPQYEISHARTHGQSGDDRWMQRRDGVRIYASGAVTAQRDQPGNVISFSKVLRDLTQWRNTEAALRQAKEEAEKLNKSKDHFLAVLSHELRTPLSPVLMSVQLLATDPSLPEPVTEALQVIRRNVELEARLIDDLLDITRISRNKLQLNLAETDLHTAVRSVLEICASDVSGKRHGLHMHLNAKESRVLADPARLQQILWNLVKNAVKFTPMGGAITVSTRNNHGAIEVLVEDTGVGIAPDVMPRIFNAFEQGEESITRRYGGLGLGLSIAHALTVMHGGQLTVRSEGVDHGSTFTFSMKALANESQGAAATPDLAPYPPRLLRVLFVEDHADTAQVMTRVLGRFGYDVKLAGTVKDALRLAEQERFDILISDIGLPDGTGLDIIHALDPKIPAVALTGFGMDQDIQRSHDAGFQEHLTKPVNIEKLQAVLRSLTRDARRAAKPKP